MTTTQRKYKTKDVDFLITADTIIDSAIANQSFLGSKRANWTAEYFQGIKSQVNQAIQNHLGVDSARELRMASQIVYSIMAETLTKLAEVKVQIEEDFKDNPPQKTEILNTLGFTTYYFDGRCTTGRQKRNPQRNHRSRNHRIQFHL